MNSEKYTELRDRHAAEVNALPMAWAFSDRQLEEVRSKLGVKSDDELCRGPGGSICRKTDLTSILNCLKRHNMEMSKAMEDEEFAISAFEYEAANHEYYIAMEPDFDMAHCFGYPYSEEDGILWDKVPNGEFLRKCYIKGVRRHIKWCNEHDAY